MSSSPESDSRAEIDLVSGASRVDDSGQFQHIARCAPATVAAGSVFCVRADFGGFGHQQIQFALRQVIELLQFQFSVEQMAAEPFAGLLLRWDVSVQGASQRGCAILRLCRFSAGLNLIRLCSCWPHVLPTHPLPGSMGFPGEGSALRLRSATPLIDPCLRHRNHPR